MVEHPNAQQQPQHCEQQQQHQHDFIKVEVMQTISCNAICAKCYDPRKKVTEIGKTPKYKKMGINVSLCCFGLSATRN